MTLPSADRPPATHRRPAGRRDPRPARQLDRRRPPCPPAPSTRTSGAGTPRSSRSGCAICRPAGPSASWRRCFGAQWARRPGPAHRLQPGRARSTPTSRAPTSGAPPPSERAAGAPRAVRPPASCSRRCTRWPPGWCTSADPGPSRAPRLPAPDLPAAGAWHRYLAAPPGPRRRRPRLGGAPLGAGHGQQPVLGRAAAPDHARPRRAPSAAPTSTTATPPTGRPTWTTGGTSGWPRDYRDAGYADGRAPHAFAVEDPGVQRAADRLRARPRRHRRSDSARGPGPGTTAREAADRGDCVERLWDPERGHVPAAATCTTDTLMPGHERRRPAAAARPRACRRTSPAPCCAPLPGEHFRLGATAHPGAQLRPDSARPSTPHRYWRGPAWFNTNWLLERGLRRTARTAAPTNCAQRILRDGRRLRLRRVRRPVHRRPARGTAQLQLDRRAHPRPAGRSRDRKAPMMTIEPSTPRPRRDVRRPRPGAGTSAATRGTAPDGLFVRDARHLSRWQLTVDGAGPRRWRRSGTGERRRAVVLVPRRAPATSRPPTRCFREQAVGGGAFVETHDASSATVPAPTTVPLALDRRRRLRRPVRAALRPPHLRQDRAPSAAVETATTAWSSATGAGDWRSSTTVTAHPAPPRPRRPVPDGDRHAGTARRPASWPSTLAGARQRRADASRVAAPPARPAPAGAPGRPASRPGRLRPDELRAPEGAFAERRPRPAAPDRRLAGLAAACAQGLADLAGLQVPGHRPGRRGAARPGRGRAVVPHPVRPGRPADLPLRPAVPARDWPRPRCPRSPRRRRTELRRRTRSPSPARSSHEMRHGELAHFGQVPYGRYYGSVDATPLFLVLLGASHAERTGDTGARPPPGAPRPRGGRLDVPRRRARRRAATSSTARTSGGLANQNWKDSAGADLLRPTAPRPPAPSRSPKRRGTRTTRCAAPRDLARDGLGRRAPTRRSWTGRGATCATASTQDFWMPEADFPALALDGDGPPGRRARLRRGAPAVVGHPRQGPCADAVGRRLLAAGLLLRLGHPHARLRPGRRTTRSRTTGAVSGRTTTR